MTAGSGHAPVLDDLEALDHLDSLGVLAVVEGFAEQIRVGWEVGRSAPGLPLGTGIESILVLGVGGSGISGDVARVILEQRLAIPVQVLKGYDPVPAWVGRNTLVFAVSYSGGTEETLVALEEVHRRGSRAVAICSGGRLAELAAEYGIATVAIPGGLQPRASLGYLVIPILAVLEEMGLAPALDDDVKESVTVVEHLAKLCERSVPCADNPAKRLALALDGKVPVIYGGSAVAAVAAYRFKCDVNEYAKAPAFWNQLPEMNHNEIEGWSGRSRVAEEHVVAVLLRDEAEHPRVAQRFEISKRLIGANVADVVEVPSQGESPLARLLSLVFVTQMAAIYLGFVRGVDPGPVNVIEDLKTELNESDAIEDKE